MEDLKYQAIVLIYPDGEVDKIPITTFKHHMDYFSPHLQKSEKLVKVREEVQFEWDILRVCACNGIIVMFSLDIQEIVENPSYVNGYYAFFDIYFPEEFESKEQLLSFLEITNNYPIYFLIYNQFQIKLNDFKKLKSDEQKEEFIENNKKRLESEIHKL